MSYPRWFQPLSGVSRERKGWFIQVEGINHPLKRLFQLSSGQRSSQPPAGQGKAEESCLEFQAQLFLGRIFIRTWIIPTFCLPHVSKNSS